MGKSLFQGKDGINFFFKLLKPIIENEDVSITAVEDLMVSIPYFMTINSYYYIDEVLYNYRDTNGSIVNCIKDKNITDIENLYFVFQKYNTEKKYEKYINSSIINCFIVQINLIFKQKVLNNKTFCFYIRIVKNKLFRKCLKNCFWKSNSIKEKIIKFILKFTPMIYYKTVEFKRKKRI